KTMYSSIIWINSVKNDSSRNPHYFLETYPFFAPEPPNLIKTLPTFLGFCTRIKESEQPTCNDCS
ncbi:hypothetical protein PDK09_27855, partial [Bacillus cereus]|nr:hypothetical protein [Bacillus cereus]MDA1769732.1 hypothetical protein [Bacillus cereus]